MATSRVLKLEHCGTTQSPVPNSPFSVADERSLWIVQSGHLDLFLVSVEDDKTFGARHHILRLEPGQAVFGVGSHFPDLELVASAAPETRLLHLPQAEFQQMVAGQEQSSALQLLEEWIARFATALSDDVPPGATVTAEAGQILVIPEQPRSVVPRKGILWVSHRKGESRFRAEMQIPSINGTHYFPIARQGWLRASPESELECIESSSLLPLDPQWRGLRHFHAVVMSCLAARRKNVLEKEQARLKTRAAADRTRLHFSLLRLTTPIQKLHLLADSESVSPDPLLIACEAVGKKLGIKIKPHPDMLRGLRVSDPIASIAKASGVRIRSVALKAEWWKQDNGPFVAFLEEDKRPVALLPRSDTSYDLYDPSDGRSVLVNKEKAALLKPFAYVMYRPFPVKKLGFFDLLQFGLFGCRRELLSIVILGIAAGLMGVITPYATGIVFDTLIPGSERTQLVQMAVFLLLIGVATAMFNLARSFSVLRLEGKLDASIQAAVWDRLLSLPVSFFRNYSSGDLAQRSLGIALIRQTLTGSTLTAILSGVFSIFSFFLLFYYSWKLALLATVLVACAFSVSIGCGIVQVRRQRQISRLNGRISSLLLQFITGIAKFRVSGTEGRAFAAWAREFSRKKQIATGAGKISNILTVFNSVFPIVCNVAIFYFYYQLVQTPSVTGTPELTTGEFLAFLAAFTQFLTAALLLSSAIVSALSVVPVYERARPIFQALPEVSEAKADPGRLTGAIEISNVAFRYSPEMPPVLRELCLKVQPGQFVAFVGASGSGKSTLFRLLLGFESPESGGVFYDGHDLTGLDVQSVRQQMGVVLQSTRPTNGSIFTNIVGSAPLTIEDAWEAARLAGLEEDIRRMPMGMHTHLGDGGGSISGGQRQRLMIARAIVRRPRILLFDEATSALDNQTQAIVSRSLESLQATRLVIAHRLSTVIKADWIFVLDKGSIAQSGTYQQLIEQPGIFRELAKRQIT